MGFAPRQYNNFIHVGKNRGDSHFIFRLQNRPKRPERYQNGEYAFYEIK